MQQRWWIGVVAVVGIGLAILLFPRPDTGADIPPADPTNTDPLDFDGDQPDVVRPDRAGNRPQIDPSRVVKGPNPAARKRMELRSQPPAQYAAKLTGPWSAIKYSLAKAQTDEASALADEITPILSDLRTIRRDPTEKPFSELEALMNEVAEKVAASEWAEDETIVTSLERYRMLLEEFHAEAAAGEQPQPQPTEEAAQEK